jgi:acid-sensing ion channel, other
MTQLEFRMPYETPMLSTSCYNVPLEGSVTFLVKPKMMVTEDKLRDYSVESRECYFSNERHLKYFEQYTQSNCEVECEANLTLQYCQCSLIFIESI